MVLITFGYFQVQTPAPAEIQISERSPNFTLLSFVS